MQFCVVPTEHVAAVWYRAEEHLARACDRSVGDISVETLRQNCGTGHAALLLILDGSTDPIGVPAAGVAQFVRDADGKETCELVAAGGRMISRWRCVIPEFEAWARQCGAVRVRLCGRPGWTKVFADYQVTPLVALVKEL